MSISFLADTRVVAWRLEEASRMLELCREAGVPAEDLLELPVKRQRENAAERLLLHHVFGRPMTLLHTCQGAPYLEGCDVNISFSHTPQLVVMAWNGNHVIGIDAERCDRQQVLKVRDKFLNDKEKTFIPLDDLASHIIAWTAKEAIIKATRNSALDWTEGIVLEPFIPNPDETSLTARCGGMDYRLMCRQIEGHHVTVAVPL